MESCFVPSEANVPQRLQTAFGEVVEMFVQSDYCFTKGGCQEFLRPGTTQTDFFDVAMGFARCRHLGAYLKMHNPALDDVLLVTQCESKKDSGKHFPVPDIITHEPPDRTEFYEIKPNSASGKRAGRDKIIWFEIICTNESLPYVAGSQYSPNVRKLVWDGTWLGSPVKVRLHWFLEDHGLLVYELCLEASLETLAEVFVKALIRLAVAALIVLLLGGAPILVLAQADSLTSPLTGPVGPDEANDSTDVAYAQLLLNDWRGRNGLELIGVDGAFDSVGSAITDFEEAQGLEASGRLEAGTGTLQALEQEHLGAVAQAAEVATSELGEPTLPPEPELIAEPVDEDEEPVDDVASLDLGSAVAEALQSYLDDLHAGAAEGLG